MTKADAEAEVARLKAAGIFIFDSQAEYEEWAKVRIGSFIVLHTDDGKILVKRSS